MSFWRIMVYNNNSRRGVERSLELNNAMWDMLVGEALYSNRKSMVPVLLPIFGTLTVPSGIVRPG